MVAKLKKLSKKKKITYIVTAVLVAVLMIGGFMFYKGYNLLQAFHSKNSNALAKVKDNQNINILIVGIDAGKFVEWNRMNDIGRTDTVILASFNPKEKKIKIVSVPRDTRVLIKGKYDKINAAFPLGGIDQSIQSVSDLLGVPVHHYVQLNYASFEEVVNILDGVTVDVDPGIKNSINIPPGLFTPGVQKLKGDKAFFFVQARNSDLERVSRQQVFLKALFAEIKKPENIVKIPRIMDAVKDDIKTDMNSSEMLSLSNKIRQVPAENIQSEMIPGNAQYIEGVSYYLPDTTKIKEIIKNLKIVQ